jgi:hypothetical protein
MHNDHKVEEWAAAETFKSPTRKSVKKTVGRVPGASPTAYSASDDFLTGESPTKAKRTYKVKSGLTKPSL